MTLGNMREQGVRYFIAYCLNDACGHRALIDKRLDRLEGPPWKMARNCT
jgi:hypothetical protein